MERDVSPAFCLQLELVSYDETRKYLTRLERTLVYNLSLCINCIHLYFNKKLQMLFFEKKIEKYLILHVFKEINKISRINITFLFVLTNEFNPIQ